MLDHFEAAGFLLEPLDDPLPAVEPEFSSAFFCSVGFNSAGGLAFFLGCCFLDFSPAGDFCDWFYGATGALSYTFELGTRFVPAEEEVPGIVAKNLDAVRYFLSNTVTTR